MTRLHARTRGGFTLIELLAVMALAATLAALALLVAPKVIERDRSTDAVNQLQASLQISRARAQRDKLPRGVRLIVKDPSLLVTELQYIEAPPVYVPNPDGPAGSAYVQFSYTTNAGGETTDRRCEIRGLTPDQINQITFAISSGQQPILWLPILGTWHKMTGSGPTTPPAADALAVRLDYVAPATGGSYPDAQLGAAGPQPNGAPQPVYRTYHFGIYGPPRPLLGEPTIQLPTDTCVDLNAGVSSPAGVSPNDFDILFGSSGQVVTTTSTGGAGHVFLWIRDPTKTQTMRPADLEGNAVPPYNYQTAQYTAALQAGGEQMIVAIKKSGAIGAAPVYWPDAANGDPYFFARKAVSAP